MVTPYAEMWQDTTQATQVGLSFVPVFVHRFEVWTLDFEQVFIILS